MCIILAQSSTLFIVLLFFIVFLSIGLNKLSTAQCIRMTIIICLAFGHCLLRPHFLKNYYPVRLEAHGAQGAPDYCTEKTAEVYCRAISDSFSEASATASGNTTSAKSTKKIRIHIYKLKTTAGAVFQADLQATLYFSGITDLYYGSEFVVKNEVNNSIVYSNTLPLQITYPNALWKLRKNIKLKLNQSFPDTREAGLVRALLFGDRNKLEAGLPALFRKAGIAHILALSGMHLHFVCAIFMLLLSGFLGRKLVFLVMCPLVLFYLFIAGPLDSLVRGAVFWFVFSLDRQFRLGLKSRYCLLLTAGIMLVINPLYIASLSFLFSFTALAGILWLSGPLSFFFKKFIPPCFAGPIAAGLSAYTVTLPLQILFFQATAPGGIIISVLISPFVFLYMTVGCSLLVLPDFVHGPVLAILRLLYNIIEKICLAGLRFPYLRIGTTVIFWYLLVLCTGLTAHFILSERKLKQFDQLQFSTANKKITGRKRLIHVKAARSKFSDKRDCA